MSRLSSISEPASGQTWTAASAAYNPASQITSLVYGPVTGANGATQSIVYDSFNRPNSATSVDGAVTNYTDTYLPNTQTATISTTTNGTTTTQWKKTTYDGSTQVVTGNNAVSVTEVDTQYGACGCSPLGKMIKTSLPYASGGTPSWTTYTYDGSGRTLTETKPDNSVTTTSYAGNSTTVTDPAGKWKTYVSDAAGGLTQVVEPNPSSTNINPVTYYTLNGAGQIVGVSVERAGVYQNRTFVWSGSDLTSATDPETGTTTYQYDGNHHVTLRTDAKWQQTKYSYDSYERLVEVQHYGAGTCQTCAGGELTNQRVYYTYDVNPLDPGNYTNSWGRLTGVSFQQQSLNQDQFAYYYSYNQAGRVTTDTFQASNGSSLLANLAATYAWDNQGRMTNMTYPSGPQWAYQYDAMGRLSGITSPNYPSSTPGYGATVTATYTGIGQLSTLNYGASYVETRSYNSLLQLTSMVTTGPPGTLLNMQYNYTAGQNNGRVSSTTDNVLGETVNYTYDMWNRLTSAVATNGTWGESYTFDNFGNLTGKTPTAGTAPTMSVPANLSNNQPTGLGSYDANGNPFQPNPVTGEPNYTWDVENRLVNIGGNVNGAPYYSYDPWGRRVWKEVPGGRDQNNNPLPNTGEYYFYGLTAQKLETYNFTASTGFTTGLEGINVYFGGKLLQSKGAWVVTDKLGSVRANSNGQTMSYFPYGEERESPNTPNGVEKFGTYTRDAVGQDYALQRYYNSNMGAFWTPDPGGIKTANSSDPTSWNRFAYVSGDPVNHSDAAGMLQDMQCGPGWETDASLEGPCCDPSEYGLFGPPDPACYVFGGDSGGSGDNAVLLVPTFLKLDQSKDCYSSILNKKTGSFAERDITYDVEDQNGDFMSGVEVREILTPLNGGPCPIGTTSQGSQCVGAYGGGGGYFEDTLSLAPGYGTTSYIQSFQAVTWPNLSGVQGVYDQPLTILNNYTPSGSATNTLVETSSQIKVNGNAGLASNGRPNRCK